MSVPSPTADALSRHREEIESVLAQLFPPADASDRLRSAMHYAVVSQGKRIRPVLALLCAEALGAESRFIVGPACALEIVHTASLVLDDMPCMDNSPVRRGRKSLHAVFGEDIACLTAVSLIAESYGLIARAPGLTDACRAELVSVLSRTISVEGLAGGQEQDLQGQATTAGDLYEIHRRKTAALFVAAIDFAALIADASASQRASLRRFADELGLAFQTLDDIADAPAPGRLGGNVVSVLGADGAERAARSRLREARAALRDAGVSLTPLGAFVEQLFSRATLGVR
jgi:geranylgeranyl diphosphate synthase, type II